MNDCIVTRRGGSGGTSSVGTALSQDVLSGKTFSNKDQTGLTGILDVEKGSYLTNSLSEWEAQACDNYNQWKAICYGDGLFVAVSNGGGDDRIMFSKNGIDWDPVGGVFFEGLTSVCYGYGRFVAISRDEHGDRSAMISLNGKDWTSYYTPKGIYGWNDVCYGNGLFVAVSDNLTGQQVMTSPYGSNWAIQSVPQNSWVSVCYGNGMFVAVAADGDPDSHIMTSSNGVKWSLQSTPRKSRETPCVCYGKGIFVVADSDHVMTSLDGISWTLQSIPESSNNWSAVCYGNGLFVATSANDSADVMTSPDGINWALQSNTDSRWKVNSICYGGGLFAAVGNGADGHEVRLSLHKREEVSSPITTVKILGDWKLRYGNVESEWASLCYGNGLYVAVAQEGGHDRLMTSPNGIHWTVRVCPDNIWRAICYGKGQFVAVGGSKLITSSDGINWELKKIPGTESSWGYICYGNGLFIATGLTGEIMTSIDGVDWKLQTGPYISKGGPICYGNNLFVGLAHTEKYVSVITSRDGTNWETTELADSGSWASTCYGNDRFVAVTRDKTIHSLDGIKWISQGLEGKWVSVCYGNELFIATEDGGNHVAVSSDGINWTKQELPGNGDVICYGNGMFVIAGFGCVMTAEVHHQLITTKAKKAVFLGSFYGKSGSNHRLEFDIRSYCDYYRSLKIENFIIQFTYIEAGGLKGDLVLSWDYDSQTGILAGVEDYGEFAYSSYANIYIIS